MWSCPDPTIISGEIYSGVPQYEFASAEPSSYEFILARPKSASSIYPSSPSKIFSGLRSLYKIFELCKYPKAKAICTA